MKIRKKVVKVFGWFIGLLVFTPGAFIERFFGVTMDDVCEGMSECEKWLKPKMNIME